MSQSAYLINHLASVENIKVNVHDAKVLQSSFEIEMEAQGHSPNPMVQFFGQDEHLAAVKDCSSIVVMTESDEFKTYNYQQLRSNMAPEHGATIYDLRAYLDLGKIKACGFEKTFRLGSGLV